MYNRADIGAIAQDLAEFRDSFLDSDPMASSAETNWTRLRDAIHDAMNKHIPTKTITQNRSLPWYNRLFKRQHRNEVRAYNRAKQSNNTQDWLDYKNIQKTLQKETKHAEIKYTSTFLTNNTQNPKKFFSFFKAHKQDTTGITTLLHNDSLVTHPQDKANTLNTQFQSVFTQEHIHLPDILISPYTAIPPS